MNGLIWFNHADICADYQQMPFFLCPFLGILGSSSPIGSPKVILCQDLHVAQREAMQPAVRRRAGCAGAEMIITDKHHDQNQMR